MRYAWLGQGAGGRMSQAGRRGHERLSSRAAWAGISSFKTRTAIGYGIGRMGQDWKSKEKVRVARTTTSRVDVSHPSNPSDPEAQSFSAVVEVDPALRSLMTAARHASPSSRAAWRGFSSFKTSTAMGYGIGRIGDWKRRKKPSSRERREPSPCSHPPNPSDPVAKVFFHSCRSRSPRGACSDAARPRSVWLVMTAALRRPRLGAVPSAVNCRTPMSSIANACVR